MSFDTEIAYYHIVKWVIIMDGCNSDVNYINNNG